MNDEKGSHMEHLHILTKDRTGALGGGPAMTMAEAKTFLEGSGHADEVGLGEVLRGRMQRGYHVDPETLTWVAIYVCRHDKAQGCREDAVSAVLAADTRLVAALRQARSEG